MAAERTQRSGWKALLFPEPERSLPGERELRTVFRTAHIAAMAILLGGHAFDVSPARLHLALGLTIGTGLALVALEMYGSLNWCFQIRGLATILKVLLVCLVPLLWDLRVHLLLTVLVIGSISSHMGARWRHYSVLTGRQAQHKKG